MKFLRPLVTVVSLFVAAIAIGQSEFELTIPQGARSQVMVDVGGSVPTAKYWAVFDDESNMIAYDADPNDWDIDIVNTAPGTYKIVVKSPYPIPLETYELWAWDESGGWASVLANIVPSQFLSLSDVTNESVNVSAASEAYQPSYARLELRKGTGAWTLAEQYVPVDDDPVQIDLEELDPNSDYTVRLSSFGASGQTDYATAQFHTKPDGPDQVGVFAVSDSSIAVYWSRVQGATAYKVYRASNLGQYNWGSPVAVINTNLNQPILKWVDTGLPSYSMRYYRVTAIVDGYQSQPSDEDCHYANPNALPWDQTPQDVVDELDNLSFPYLFPINGNAAITMPMGEYQDSVEPTLTANPAGRVDEDREMITSGGMVSPFLGDGLRAKITGDSLNPSDLSLVPQNVDVLVQAEGAYTRRDAPQDDFIGISGTFIFPSFDNPLYFLCQGVTPDGSKPANSLNMYVGWAPPIPTGPEASDRTVTADIGIQYYPASDNSGTPRQNEPGVPGDGLPPRYNPFIRVSNGKEIVFESLQLNNATLYPAKRYLEAYSPTGWLFATIRVAYLADSKLILFQTVWGTCNSNGTGKSPASAPFPVLAAPSSGPFYGPKENMGGQDLESQKPFSFDDRMTSRRVVSVAQNDHVGTARALHIYEGAANQPSDPETSPWLWRQPFAAYVDSSYAREVKMQGWECMGYSGTWLDNPFDTEELDTGNYLRFARHNTGSTPFGCIYHGFHPLLDSIVSIDHTVSP